MMCTSQKKGSQTFTRNTMCQHAQVLNVCYTFNQANYSRQTSNILNRPYFLQSDNDIYDDMLGAMQNIHT